MPITLKQLADKLGVSPYDLTGDNELTDIWMNEDITDTIFYQDLLHSGELDEYQIHPSNRELA